MSFEHVNSLEPGFIARQLQNADKAVAKWPLWMRREAGLLPPCKHRFSKGVQFPPFCTRCGTRLAEVWPR